MPKLEHFARFDGSPRGEQFRATRSHLSQVFVGENPGEFQMPVEIFRRPDLATRTLAIEHSNDRLHFLRFVGQRTARRLPGGLLYVPTFGNQPKESAPKPEHSLHREMRQIVQGEKWRMIARLLLPGRGSIGANAAQDAGAVFAFCDLNKDSYCPAGGSVFASRTAINLRSSATVLS
jgi:hypothetical protein